MNICTFTGRLTKDPELKSTPSGVSYVRFTLAVERGYGKDNTYFLRFVIWGEPAKRAVDWLSKGDLIGVKNSRAQVSEFRDQKTGNTVRVTEFHTNEFLEFLNIKKKKEKTTAAACDQEPDTTQAPTATPQSAVESQNNNMVHEDISDTPQNCDDYEDFLVDCYGGEFPFA